MREQRINLEGRLGGEGKSRRGSYGISRLGILRDSSMQPEAAQPPPVAASPQPVEPVAPASEPVESLPPQREQWQGGQTQTQWTSEPPPAKSRKFLLTAGAAVVVSMLAWWLWPHGSPSAAPAAAPQAAAPAAAPPASQAAAAPVATAAETKVNPALKPKALPLAGPVENPPGETDPWELEPATPSAPPLATVPPAKVSPSPVIPAAIGPATPKIPVKAAAKPPQAASQPAFRLGSNLALTAILKGSNPLAIINDHAVEVGQTIEDATIVAIGDFDVEVEIDGQHYMISITAGPAFVPAASQPAEDSVDLPAGQPARQAKR